MIKINVFFIYLFISKGWRIIRNVYKNRVELKGFA